MLGVIFCHLLMQWYHKSSTEWKAANGGIERSSQKPERGKLCVEEWGTTSKGKAHGPSSMTKSDPCSAGW